MVSVDWNKFKAKFGEGSRQAFEDLSYSIFCREYELRTGVFRFRNHPALETEPILRNGKKIGFQAKFFEGKPSDCKQEMVNAIHAVQAKYPDLNQLVFYLPFDFDCNSRGVGATLVSSGQMEIENEAKMTGLTIEWFCLSRFKATLARDEYEDLGKFFFSDESGVYSLVDGLRAKTRSTLATIRTSSAGRQTTFHADRKDLLEKIESEIPCNICVIHGDGGVGKSGLIKEFSKRFDECIVLRPAEVSENFDPLHLQVKWHTVLPSLLKTYDPRLRKLFVLDSAEKLENDDASALVLQVLNQFKESGWNVVFTTRSYFRQLLETLLTIHSPASFVFIELPPLSEETLFDFAGKSNIVLPDDNQTKELLRLPFYLDTYLKTYKADRALDSYTFKRMAWEHVVAGGNTADAASQLLIDLVERRIKTKQYWIDIGGSNFPCVKSLVNRGVLSHDEDGDRYFVAHDIYEEWALERSIERLYTKLDIKSFINAIADARSMVRAYRLWLIDKLRNGKDLSELIETALSQEDKLCFDETIIAVMNSPQALRFLEAHRNRLFDNNAIVLCRVVRCVMLACRTNNDSLLPIKKNEYGNVFRNYFTKPVGPGWRALIDFLHENKESLYGFDLSDIVALLHDWCTADPKGETTRKAGELAFAFGESHDMHNKKGFEIHYPDHEKLLATITAATSEIRRQIEEAVSFVLDNYSDNLIGLGRDIARAVLKSPMEHIRFVKECPDLTCRMAKTLWICNTKQDRLDWFLQTEDAFGLDSRCFMYFPASAFQTPIYWLLHFSPIKTIDLVVEVASAALEHAAAMQTNNEITRTTFTFPDGATVQQYISDAVWSCHRGVFGPVVPNLLQSIHMALEKYLLETHEAHPEWASNLEKLLLYAIRKSKSASIAGVATSLVLAHPDEYFNLASVILTSRNAIRSDFRRCRIGERQCEQLYKIPSDRDMMYRDERISTLKDEFRHTSLETVMVHYQLVSGNNHVNRKMRMELLLDGYSKLTEDEDRYFVSRVDTRKQEYFQTTDEKGRPAIGMIPNLPQDLIDKRNSTQNELLPDQLVMNLMLWASHLMKAEAVPECCQQYDNDPLQAIRDFKFVLDAFRKDNTSAFRSLIVYPAAAFLIYHLNHLDEETVIQCKDIVFAYANLGLNDSYEFQFEDGYRASIPALPTIASIGSQKEREKAGILMLVAMLNEMPVGEYQRVCDLMFDAFRWHNENRHFNSVACIGSYIELRGLFQHYVHQHHDELAGCRNPIGLFWRAKKKEILEKAFGNSVHLTESLSDPFRFVGVLNSVLIVGTNQESVSLNRGLVLSSIEPALSFFFHPDEKKQKLSAACFTPLSIQYQQHLVQLLYVMNADDRRTALEQIAKVPLVFAEGYFLVLLVLAADRNGKKDVFWDMWKSLQDTICQLLLNNDLAWYRDDVQILEAYLLGSQLWKQGTLEWRYFDNRGIDLFEQMAKVLPPSIPLAIGFSSFAYSIGRHYWKKCLQWISKAVSFDPMQSYRFDPYLKSLRFLLESFVCNLVAEHRTEIRRDSNLANQAFTILDFLVSLHSIVGYRIRESLT